MARLGATISDYLHTSDVDAYLRECLNNGYRSAPCPELSLNEVGSARAVRDEFAKADVVIAETTAWVNPLDPDPSIRRVAVDAVATALAMADELGARCCTTVSGSFATSDMPDSHVGQHPDNFTPEALDAVVEWVAAVLRDVDPKRTFLTLEMCPWAVVDGPDVYRQLIDQVQHPQLAVHLDPANSMSSPRALFGSGEVITSLFEQLGPWVKSCHAKDVTFVGTPAVVSMMEVPPGTGHMDYHAFMREIAKLDVDTPLIMEHLRDRQTYLESAVRVRALAEVHSVTL